MSFFGTQDSVKENANLKAKLAQCDADCAAMREAFNSKTGPYVLAFAVEMEKKLALNRHKGDREGWVNDDSLDLFARLKEETKELQDVLDNMANGVTVEAADVANFAMMIADHCEGLKPFTLSGSGQALLDELAELRKENEHLKEVGEADVLTNAVIELRATAQRRLELLNSLYKRFERCPMCNGYGKSLEGDVFHKPDCALAAELKEAT